MLLEKSKSGGGPPQSGFDNGVQASPMFAE